MYIDGYNFYCSINDREHLEYLHLGWCNFASLARQIIGNRGSLVSIKYFTAPVEEFGKPGERERQALWLRALETIPELEIIRGFHMGIVMPRQRSVIVHERRKKQISIFPSP
jgi:hypothetical protein